MDNEVNFDMYEHPDVQKTWIAYYMYLNKNFKTFLMESSVTVDQFDDLYAGFFGVFGNFGSGKTPERIDDLSPMPEVKNKKEHKEREYSLTFSIVHVLMENHPFENIREELKETSVDEYIKQNKDLKSDFPSLVEIREMLIEKLKKKHENNI